MKPHLLFITMLLLLAKASDAQVLFYESFDHIAGPTAGGAGTYNFPSGWFLRNVDNRTPDAQVSYVNEAWERREDFGANVVDSCAFSTSYYSPAGAADDWMWTPVISGITANTVLSWRAKAYDGSYPDGYQVRIMTSGPPTGGTGVLGNQVSNSTVIFSTTAENSSWTTRSVNLAAYTGQSVYIGFRNNSNDQFLLAIDDVKVETMVNHDATITTANTYEYTKVPLSQAIAGIALGGTIQNLGIQSITNVKLKAEIYNSSNSLVQSITSSPVASIAANASSSFTLTAWTPATTGSYTIKYFPVLAETDDRVSNDTILRTISISDSVYARDDGTIVGQLGIGTGDGYLGQSFTITQRVELRSVSIAYTRGYANKRYALAVWNTTVTGVPNTMIATTDTLFYPDDNALLDTLRIHSGSIFLDPGKYVVTAIEFDSTIAVAQANGIFTAGTLWAKWSAHPAWANLESLGSQFGKSFNIRMNINVNNNSPVITSNGGAATAGISIAENITAATTVAATDADPGTTISYSINGGADAAKFSINSTTGVLTFITAPDFENPSDADANNTYLVTVRASDGTLTDDQAITITITNANDNTPVITSNGGGSTANISVLNPQQSVTTVTATDADGSLNTLTYSITGGADAARFSINSTTGALAFINPTNVNSPTDADLNNTYIVTVQVSDGSFNDQQTITVTVTGTMPVTLVSFNAWNGGTSNIAAWVTANESAMERYEIEKSADGRNFLKAGSVAAKGGISNEYNWTDLQPYPGVNFYRLKMIGKDGGARYSAIVKLERSGIAGQLQVYPNPVTGRTFSIELNDLSAGRYDLRLYNNAGQFVLSQVISRNSTGSSVTVITLPATVVPGIYLLTVKAGSTCITQRIIVE